MNDSNFLEHSLTALAGAGSNDDIGSVLYRARDEYGFANITYQALCSDHSGNVSARTVISTGNPEWLRQYEASQLITIDPVVKAAWQAPLPLDWDTVDRRSKSARFYFEELRRFKIGDRGFAIPLSPANRPPGLLTCISDGLGDLEWKALKRRSQGDMMLFGQHVHFHTLRVEQNPTIRAVLTERGLELVLRGHKPSSIGETLGLSVHTVRMHLRHAQERLNCHSLPEAVGKALTLGIIRKAVGIFVFGTVTQLLQGDPLIQTLSAMAA